MLVSYFENLVIEVKHMIGKIASQQTRTYRSYDRIKQYVNLASNLFHRYRMSRIKVNLFEPEV